MADLLSAPAVARIFLQVREFSGGRDLDTPGTACILRGAVGREGGGKARAGSAARQAICELQHSNAGRACLHLHRTKNSQTVRSARMAKNLAGNKCGEATSAAITSDGQKQYVSVRLGWGRLYLDGHEELAALVGPGSGLEGNARFNA